MILRRSVVPVAALLLALPACDWGPFAPDTSVVLANIGASGTGIDVAADGSDVVVSIMTYGNNTCYSRHHTDVDVDDEARTITIRPYNEREEATCGQMIVEIPHAVRVNPGDLGNWQVRIVGTAPQDDEIVVVVDVFLAGTRNELR